MFIMQKKNVKTSGGICPVVLVCINVVQIMWIFTYLNTWICLLTVCSVCFTCCHRHQDGVIVRVASFSIIYNNLFVVFPQQAQYLVYNWTDQLKHYSFNAIKCFHSARTGTGCTSISRDHFVFCLCQFCKQKIDSDFLFIYLFLRSCINVHMNLIRFCCSMWYLASKCKSNVLRS